jgi:hypothetical protein
MPINAAVDSKAHAPTGQPWELADLGLDVASYRSCSMPDPGKNAGCEFFAGCDMPYKGLPGVDAEGKTIGGPHNHGIYYVAPSGASLQDVRSCFQYFQLAPETIQSGGVYEIIADEGEEIIIKGTEVVPVNASNPGGKQRSKPFMRPELVPAFPRPKDVFHDKAYELKVREVISVREKRKRREGALAHASAAADVQGTQGVRQPSNRIPKPKPLEEDGK